MAIAILGPADEPESAIVLPNPSGISWKLAVDVNKKLTRSGKTFTYIETAQRQTFKLDFISVLQAKMYELKQFYTNYGARRVIVMLFNNEIWEAQFEFPTLPFTFTGNNQIGNTPEYGNFSLGFIEGIQLA